MAIDTNQKTEKHTTTDAPFRTGVTGKYKLLIKNVSPKLLGYEYELVDAEGKEYKAEHPKHYAEGELLRCMVDFKVANAKLTVTDTQICNKQDLTTALPEEKVEKKVRHKPIESKEVVNDPRTVDNPRQAGKKGFYYLRIADYELVGKQYSYLVEDATGIRYKVGVHTKRFLPIGTVCLCNMKVSILQGGEMVFKVLSICKDKGKAAESQPEKGKASKNKKKHKVKHVKRSHGSSSSSDWLGTPYVGTRFHLIYTPMGNKR